MGLEHLPESSPGLPTGDKGAGNVVGPKGQENVSPGFTPRGKGVSAGRKLRRDC